MMTLANAQLWYDYQKNNQDFYGLGILRYAYRWALLMEERINEGASLQEIAKATSHEADTDGITGFMYGAAVQILSQVWLHGETLRRWHNTDCQIGDEGDKANKEGSCLNPALLTVHL